MFLKFYNKEMLKKWDKRMCIWKCMMILYIYVLSYESKKKFHAIIEIRYLKPLKDTKL